MTDKNMIRALIDAHADEIINAGTPSAYSKQVDELVNDLFDLFVTPPTEFHHFYRDCDVSHLTRTLDAAKPEEQLVAVIPGDYGEWNSKDYKYGPGYRIVFKTTACNHDWSEGFSMNGPTRTCKKCGKFERD